MVDDEIFWAALSNYGEVIKGRKLYYEEFPSIELDSLSLSLVEV